ncbi:MAG TPA: HD domain-containing protein, partial [Candidatus Atribacteria bacterium]|nr:HD domain-containing protein [Candidatus Atribacteria bacterium]
MRIIMWRRHLEIRDPIHGYIFISELEKRIIDTHIFQRLRRIKQLGGAYLTYPGAEHTRFGHSLGAMHLAGVVGEHLANLGLIKEDEIEYLRIAALLHDIGHGPFSHVYEDISIKYLGKDHEDLTYWLITESEIKDILNDYGLDVEEVATLAISKKNSEKMKILDQVISSQYDVDKMDFLVRDSHFTGVQYGLVDIFRIIHSLDVINGKLAVEIPGALYALESFLIARYEMFKAVYYHRSVRSANLMLSEAMNLAREYLGIIGFKTPEEYILFDDGYIITKIRELKQTKEKELKQAYKLIEMYTKRELLKCAYEITVHTKNKFLASILTIERLR